MGKEQKDVLDVLWKETFSFYAVINYYVDYLIILTQNDADYRQKYDVASCIVRITLKHLREDDISKEERVESELFLSFYQFLQAMYESKINPCINQSYVEKLAEIYNEKRTSLNLHETLDNCDFLRITTGYDNAQK